MEIDVKIDLLTFLVPLGPLLVDVVPFDPLLEDSVLWMDVDDAPLGRLTFLPRSWSISASMSSMVSRLLLPDRRDQGRFRL
jgi:hypothetical protein